MIYLHKILPIFALPTGFSLLLMTIGLLWRKKIFCWAGILLLLVAALPWTGHRAMQAMESDRLQPDMSDIQAADAIVVLAGAPMRNPGASLIGQWPSALVNRFEAGIALYRADKAPTILFTNGWLPWRRCTVSIETSVLARAEDIGVPKSAIKTTTRVKNTAEEAAAAAHELLDNASRNIILVTSAFHMRRAKMLFENMGFLVTAFPADFRICRDQDISILDFFPSAAGLEQTETALRETYGYLYYRLLSAG